jgi:hypothetical protein
MRLGTWNIRYCIAMKIRHLLLEECRLWGSDTVWLLVIPMAFSIVAVTKTSNLPHLLLCIGNAQYGNLGPEPASLTEVSCSFPQSHQANAGTFPSSESLSVRGPRSAVRSLPHQSVTTRAGLSRSVAESCIQGRNAPLRETAAATVMGGLGGGGGRFLLGSKLARPDANIPAFFRGCNGSVNNSGVTRRPKEALAM